MNKQIKKALSAVLSLAMVAGSIALPAATAGAADTSTLKSWKFDFGATAAEGWTQVTAADAYTAEKGYGFLGQDSTVYDAVVDGYNQTPDNKTELKNGGTGSDAFHDYVYTEDDHMPIRFAVKADNNTYYKIKVTMGYSDKASSVYLTSERRHFILTDEKITAGNKIEKTFTAAVHSVKWKNRNAGTQPIYADDMINVCVHGENAMINAIEIQQVEKPKVVWIFGDSTTTDSSSGAPWRGYNTYTGWGAGVSKYLPEDIAVVNLGEGGLAINNTDYFNVGKDDMTEGDILMMAMGHNGTAPDADNIRPYYDAITNKGGTFVSCSPIERTENQYSTSAHNTTFQNFATANNCPFVSLYDISVNMYNVILGGKPGWWYAHSVFWSGTASNPTKSKDGTHLNDFGVDMVAKGALEALAAQAETYPALAPYVTAQAALNYVPVPRDLMTAKGTDDYVNDETVIDPPHKGFAYPDPAIEYDNTVDITSAQTIEKDGKTYLTSYKTVRHSDLKYITAWAAAYNADGTLAELRMNRLEPMSAKTAEDVDLTKLTVNGATTDEECEPLEIPEGGSYKTFVWEGALADDSMTYKPHSDVFSGYDTTAAAGAWAEGVTPDAETGAVTVAAEGKGVYALTTPVTSGKVMFDFDMTAGGNDTIVLSPAADGSDGAGAMTFSLNSTTGVLSRSVLNAEGKTETVEVIDSLKAGVTKNVKFIYDIDEGKLEINMDGVGIAHVDYPEAVTTQGIVPAQIASIAVGGAATVENMAAYTVAKDALPQKTLTMTYEGDKGKVTETGGETVITSKTATKNTKLQLTATATPVEGHNYVFGGWYTDADHNKVYSKEANLDYYLVEDNTLYPYFYEQQGLSGVVDYAITAKSGDEDVKLLKKPSESAAVTLDITDIVDSKGNPTAAFDHSTNVTWAIKGTAPTGASISGNTLTVTSDFVVEQEGTKKLTVTATCNNVSKDYTIVVHDFTDLVNYVDFEDGVTGKAYDNWVTSMDSRYTALIGENNGNKYMEIAAVGDGNNGTQITGDLVDEAINGVVKVQADIMFKQPTGTDKSRDSVIGFADASKYANYSFKKAVTLGRTENENNYKVNGTLLTNVPGDTDWTTVSVVMNYLTKKADVTITSLDGATEYYKAENIDFVNADVAGFKKILYDTNRYNAGAKFDNIFVDHIADVTDMPEISTTPESLLITNMTAPTEFTVTIPDGFILKSATPADANVVTTEIDAETKKVTVNPVAQGDTSITVTVASTANSYISNSIEVPVSVKKADNANLAELSIITNAGSDLIYGFNGDNITYNVKAQSDITTLTVTGTTDSEQATVSEIAYNGTPVSDGEVTIDGEADTQTVTVTVTAQDGVTTKTYTVNIDNSYLIVESFSGVANSSDWISNEGTTSPLFSILDTDTDKASFAGMTAAKNGKVLVMGSNQNGSGRNFAYEKVLGSSEYTKVNVGFDVEAFAIGSGNRGVTLQFVDSNKAKVFDLWFHCGAGTNSKFNDTEVSGFSKGTVVTVDATLDFTTHKMTYTLTNTAGTKLVDNQTVDITADNLSEIYLAPTDWQHGKFALDNFYIKPITE